MTSYKEQLIKEKLDKELGNRESVKDLKRAILLSQTGKLTDDVIEEYKRQKEEEQRLIREQFDELNPSYSFDYIKETPTIQGMYDDELLNKFISKSPDNINDVVSESRGVINN